MKKTSNTFFSFLMAHKFWSAVLVVVIFGLIWYLFFSAPTPVDSFMTVSKGTIREEVSVTGNVRPLSDVDLAFERGGRVAGIAVEVGDKVYVGQYLASVSNADLTASLDQAKASLKIAELRFGQSSDGQTIQNSSLDKASLDLMQAKTSLVNTIRDSYTKADDAVKNKIYSLFTDPARYRAKLIFATDASTQERIENDKDIITEDLYLWYKKLSDLNTDSDLDLAFNLAQKNLVFIKSLLDNCALAVNNLSVEPSYLTQTQIDTWKVNISVARTNIDTAIGLLVSSHNQYEASVLALKTAGNSFSVQSIEVDQAKANVASVEAELAKTIIWSPITGVITNIDTKLGEIVSANKMVISVISYGAYEVESFIPEADIAKIKISDKARTTLDAYGDGVVFNTEVIKIDPAATVIDGVPTYKVTLRFTDQDNRIKSGMTANLDILSAEKSDVILVPARVLYTKDGKRYVKRFESDDSIIEIEVQIGLRGVDGNVEIISGINEGDKIVSSL